MLAMGVLLVVGGRLGDKFGQRRLFLIGRGGFTLASAIAGFSPDPALLIVARVAQGAFGALLIPQGVAIMTKAFDRDMLARAFGLFGPVLGLSSVGGPVLAGFLISADVSGLSWRPIFLSNVVLGVIGLVMAVRILPRDDDGDRSTVVNGRASGLLAGNHARAAVRPDQGLDQRLGPHPDRLDYRRRPVLRCLRLPSAHRDPPAHQALAHEEPGFHLRNARVPGRRGRRHRIVKPGGYAVIEAVNVKHAVNRVRYWRRCRSRRWRSGPACSSWPGVEP